MKATWNGKVIAQSDKTIVIEGNYYFPPASVNMEYFTKNDFHTTCPWKGLAHYYTIDVDGIVNENGAWYYPVPNERAIEIVKQQSGVDFSGYVAFWQGVEVSE